MKARLLIKALLVVGSPVLAIGLLLLGYASSNPPGLRDEELSESTLSLPGTVPVSTPSMLARQPREIGESGQRGAEGCALYTTIVPDEMTLVGDVTTRANCDHPTVCSWLDDTPTGTIMLGVDPTSPYTSAWDSGLATAEIYIGDIVSPTVGILTVSWPDRDGKGIHSPIRDQVATVSFDGTALWAKRTLDQSTFGDYYAAEHRPVMLTFVVTQSITHTLTFSVPAHIAWDISQATVQLCPMPSTIKGLAYSPFRDCQTPHWGDLYPSIDEIREDMPLLFHSSNAIRTYSSLDTLGQIPALAHEWGLRISPGAWLGREVDEDGNPVPNRNAEDIGAVISIANTVPVESVIVGNEVLLRGDLTITQLISYINHIRASIPPTVEVTTAEIWPIWMGHDGRYSQEQVDQLVEAVDYILMHSHPYWAYISVDEAITRIMSEYKALQQRYPDKRIVIGETGWPTGGEINGAAVPSVENQLHFLTQFLYLADQEGIEFYYFDAFDELWKRWPSREKGGEGEAGAHWGLWYADRTAKHVLQGVLFPGSVLFPHRVYLPLILKDGESRETALFTGSPTPLPLASDRDIASSDVVTFSVYTEWIALDNHFIPSGWMGDWDNIDFYECERTNPHSGELAIRVTYNPTGTLGWAGIYWQEPENNWGTVKDAGYDLDNATALSFYARGEKGGEQVEFLIGGIWGPYPDSQQPAISTDVITLTTDWREYTIDLRGKDLSRTIGGFAFVTNRCLNSEPVTFYLDDIQYILEGDPGMPSPTPTPTGTYYFNVYRDKDVAGNHYVPSGFMGDIGDISVNECWTENTYTGSTAIRVDYAARGTGPSYGCESYGPPCNWAGVYWQYPANNWGDRPGGYDLSGAQAVTFWARGEKGGEKIEFKIGGIGRDIACTPIAPYPGSLCPPLTTGVRELSTDWQPITLTIPADANLNNVKGGFLWVATQAHNPGGATFYLDDIRYVFNLPAMPTPTPTPISERFYVYTDRGSLDNHFVPSGWMGDTGDISFNDGHTGTTCGGTTAIRLSYSARGNGPSYSCEWYGPPCWWAGIYWLQPENNWCTVPDAGFDLSEYNKLVFCARGEVGGEHIKFGVDGLDCDSTPKASQWITLTPEWQEYTIDLTGRDLSNIIGGFLWVTNRDKNPSGAVFYLDEIRYER